MSQVCHIVARALAQHDSFSKIRLYCDSERVASQTVALESQFSKQVMSHTYEWVMSHIWKSSVTNSCSRVAVFRMIHVWQIWMSHVTHGDESCHTSERVASQIVAAESQFSEWFMSDTYEWVMSHIWKSRVTNMNEACLTHMNVSQALLRQISGSFAQN